MSIQSAITTVTPDLAKIMLNTYDGNRVIRKNWVDQLSKLISDDEFMTTHQGIAFDDNGRLIDGQHRLLACIKADKEIKVMITKGLPFEVWYALDQGILRSYSDILSVPKPLSDILGRAHRLAIGGKANPQDLLIILNSVIGKISEDLLSETKAKRKVVSSAAVKLAAVLSPCLTFDKEYAFAQYKALVRSDFDSMSEITKLLYKQSVSGQINPVNLEDTLGKSLISFDPKNSLIGRFVQSSMDQKVYEARAFVKEIFLTADSNEKKSLHL